MALLRTLLLTAGLAACATARTEPGNRDGDDQQVMSDAAMARADAPAQSTADAPTSNTGCTQVFTGVLATWDFASESGTQASTIPKNVASGVVASPIQRAAALTAVSGANAIN